MIKSGPLCVLGLLLCLTTVYGQELLLDELPALKDKALVLQITTKIEENSQELWNAFNSKVTIPGRPVSIKLVGENLIISVQFTPYLNRGRYTLRAQSQIWINIPDKGMSYKTNTYSIPMDFGEPILYLPLGSNTGADTPQIELHLTMYRYGEEPAQPDTTTPPKTIDPTETKTGEATDTDPRRNRPAGGRTN